MRKNKRKRSPVIQRDGNRAAWILAIVLFILLLLLLVLYGW